MTPEWITFGRDYGWIALVVTYAMFKSVPMAVEKIWPNWMTAQQAERARVAKAAANELAAVQAVYEKFIALQAQTIQFVASATDSIREMSRAMDYNTRQIERLTHAVEDSKK